MDTLQELKFLHDLGFALIWLYPKSKRPIGDDWASGPRHDWEVFKAQRKNEKNNVGVRLGEASKTPDGSFLCALDCDVKSSNPIHLKEMEAALMDFCPAHEFAPRVLSGRGGGSCHIYFRTPVPQVSFKAVRSSHRVKVYMPSVAPSASDKNGLTDEEIKAGYRMRLAWEVDVFGNGKQVVLPPSIHPDSSKPYQWAENFTSFEAFPLVKNFEPQKVKDLKGPTSKISFAPVDLGSTSVSEKIFKLITSGEGSEKFPSRSEAIFSALNGLVSAGLSDAQIFSVMTNSENFISEKPLASGKGDPELAAKWLSKQLDKVRSDSKALRGFKEDAIIDDIDELIALSPEEALAQEKELIHWETRLQRDKNGNAKATANNLYLILRNDFDGTPLFAYNAFKQSMIYMKTPPWGSERDIGREIEDKDDVDVKLYLSKNWGLECSTQNIVDIISNLAYENTFHPVKRYLEGLVWDGKKRLDTWLVDYLGAEGDTEYLAHVGRKTLVGAVSRIYKPGCKFDTVLILEGYQGAGKSTTIQNLASPEWFVDNLGDIASKDVINVMRGRWIIEVAELDSMDRATVNALKSFFSRQSDINRLAFARREKEFKRQCIFIGSTNQNEYLKDPTGGRRFWPVKISRCDSAGVAAIRDQLWAEAMHLYGAGEKTYLDDERVMKIARQEADDRYAVDEIEADIQAAMSRAPEVFGAGSEFTFEELWAEMNSQHLAVAKPADLMMQSRIKRALTRMGYHKFRKRVGDWKDNVRVYVYKKERRS